MNWIKASDKKPEDGRELLLCYTDAETGSVYAVGFYDTDDKIFIELHPYSSMTVSDLTVSHWAYITMPPGEGGLHVHKVLDI